ncbi:MAG: transposase [Nitrospinota bacterium]
MPKLKRFVEPGAGYFVTSVTSERRAIFRDERAVRLFLTILRDYKEELSFKVHGYVVMPDHVHLFLQPGGSASLSEIMKRVKGKFARRYNREIKPIGTVWQHSFHEEGLRNEAAFWKKMNYILENPVRKGLTASSGAFPFSSATVYLEGVEDGITDRYPA